MVSDEVERHFTNNQNNIDSQEQRPVSDPHNEEEEPPRTHVNLADNDYIGTKVTATKLSSTFRLFSCIRTDLS